MRSLSLVSAAVVVTCCASCGGGVRHVRAYPEPTVDDVLAHLRAHDGAITSFQAETLMDYWVHGERVKGTVLLLGARGRRLRFNAENPTGGNVAVDLACDGASYALIDYNRNCQLTGPCTRAPIAQLLGIDLDPDDFYRLATGSTPLIAAPTGRVTWDARHAREVVELVSADERWRQTIVLDGREHRWDVLASTVTDAGGDVVWALHNKQFAVVHSPDGATARLPGKTRFEQPARKADLVVVWRRRQLNLPLADDKFALAIPAGLATCRNEAEAPPR